MLREAAREFGADLISHVGQEESMGLAARVAEDLGIAVNSAESVHRLNDKVALRRLLEEHDLSPSSTRTRPTGGRPPRYFPASSCRSW